MSTKQQQSVLPAAIAKLYRAIITRDDKGEIDWTTAATELVLVKFKDSPAIHTKATPTIDTNLKGIRRGQFARLACSVRCPNEPEGSEEYVVQRDKAQRHFNNKIVDALVRMEYWERKARGESNKGNGKGKTPPATVPPQVGEIPVASIMSKAHEIETRVQTCQNAVAAFQSKVTLQEDGTKRIGVIAGDLGALLNACKELGKLLVVGAIEAALTPKAKTKGKRKSVTPPATVTVQ